MEYTKLTQILWKPSSTISGITKKLPFKIINSKLSEFLRNKKKGNKKLQLIQKRNIVYTPNFNVTDKIHKFYILLQRRCCKKQDSSYFNNYLYLELIFSLRLHDLQRLQDASIHQPKLPLAQWFHLLVAELVTQELRGDPEHQMYLQQKYYHLQNEENMDILEWTF